MKPTIYAPLLALLVTVGCSDYTSPNGPPPPPEGPRSARRFSRSSGAPSTGRASGVRKT